MRHIARLVSLAVLAPALVALPAAPASVAAPRPVPPSVVEQPLPLAGPEAAGAEADSGSDEHGHDHGGRVLVLTDKTATSDFSALGVTWAHDPAITDVTVEVRTRTDDRWSGWEEVEVQANSAPDPGSAEGRQVRRDGTDPLWVGESDGVQVRVETGTQSVSESRSKRTPRDLRLALIDPGTARADSAVAGRTSLAGRVTTATAAAAESRPAYVSRAGWGADESLRSCTPSKSSTIKAAIVHTTATSNSYTASQSPAIMRSMYAYHTQNLGWCDLGYNIVVDKYGTVYEGRYGGFDQPVIGAHTGGFNSYTFGVSMIGNHDYEAPSAVMRSSLEKVLAWKLGLHGRDPEGRVDLVSAGGSSTKWPYGTVVRSNVISGHRDFSSKSCPGNLAYPLLGSIRESVASRMSAPDTTTLSIAAPRTIEHGAEAVFSGRLTTSGGDPLPATSVTLLARPEGSATWTSVVRTTTAADGTYRFSVQPERSGDYTARFWGSADHVAGKAPIVSVTVTPRATTLDLTAGNVTTVYGDPLIATGRLRTTSGTGIAGTRVEVITRASTADSWTTLGTATTAADGSYRAEVLPPSSGELSARSAGSTASAAATARPVALTVTPRPTALTASAPTTSVYGTQVQVRGRLTATSGTPLDGARVSVLTRADGTTAWVPAATATTGTDGGFVASVTPAVTGEVTVRFAGTAQDASADAAVLPLDVTARATVLTTTVPGKATHGQRTAVRGRLAATTGAGVPGARVALYTRTRNNERWSALASVTTAADGSYTLPVTATENRQYTARWWGTRQNASSRSGASVMTVAPKVTASLSTSTVSPGSQVTLTAKVSPAHQGQSVHRQAYVDGAWRTWATARLSSTGGASFTIRPTAKSSFRYRVYVPADADHGAAASSALTLTVR